MSATWNLPSGPEAAGAARSVLRGWLDGVGAGPDDEASDSILLAASEAAANAGVHGCPPVTLAVFAAPAPGGTEVIVAVTDASPAVPRQRHAAELDEHGRGLDIIGAVTDWHTIAAGPGCKQLRFGVTVPGLSAGRGACGDGSRNEDPFGITGSGVVPDGSGRRVLAS